MIPRMTPVRTLLLSVATLAAAVAVLDLSGGSTSESYGVVNSVSPAGGPGGAAERVARVRLESGKLVEASVPDGIKAREGDSVHVRILSRLSGASTYQVLGPRDERMGNEGHG